MAPYALPWRNVYTVGNLVLHEVHYEYGIMPLACHICSIPLPCPSDIIFYGRPQGPGPSLEGPLKASRTVQLAQCKHKRLSNSEVEPFNLNHFAAKTSLSPSSFDDILPPAACVCRQRTTKIFNVKSDPQVTLRGVLCSRSALSGKCNLPLR